MGRTDRHFKSSGLFIATPLFGDVLRYTFPDSKSPSGSQIRDAFDHLHQDWQAQYKSSIANQPCLPQLNYLFLPAIEVSRRSMVQSHNSGTPSIGYPRPSHVLGGDSFSTPRRRFDYSYAKFLLYKQEKLRRLGEEVLALNEEKQRMKRRLLHALADEIDDFHKILSNAPRRPPWDRNARPTIHASLGSTGRLPTRVTRIREKVPGWPDVINLPLPEDFVMRGRMLAENYVPDDWFAEADEEERNTKIPSTMAPLVERILNYFILCCPLGHKIIPFMDNFIHLFSSPKNSGPESKYKRVVVGHSELYAHSKIPRLVRSRNWKYCPSVNLNRCIYTSWEFLEPWRFFKTSRRTLTAFDSRLEPAAALSTLPTSLLNL